MLSVSRNGSGRNCMCCMPFEPLSDYAYSLLNLYFTTETIEALRQQGGLGADPAGNAAASSNSVGARPNDTIASIAVVEALPAAAILDEARKLGAD